jgi:protein-tyrosine-phosphatase
MIVQELLQNIEKLTQHFDSIDSERKTQLESLSAYIQQKYKEQKTPKLIVICTHNSRRSHLGQLWLAAAADYYKLPALESYSGGTEATAFNPNAVAAVKRIGFDISKLVDAENSIYNVFWKEDQYPYQAFSKRFEEPPNPTSEFAAIMVCSEADEGCPFVPGTDFRIALPFDDPKAFDGTPQEAEKYDERCEQIGMEMLYVLSRVSVN